MTVIRMPAPKHAAAVIAVIIACLLLLHYLIYLPGFLPQRDRIRDDALHQSTWRHASDYDIVVALYSEPEDVLQNTIATVILKLPPGATHRVIIYVKDGRDTEAMNTLLAFADEVVALPNVGREGETYLNHIVRHYDTAAYNLAEHTFFLQPHIAWDWVMMPRLDTIRKDTGFLSFGPYINQTCGKDSGGMEFHRMADIYSMFRGDFCPPYPVLATWAGQFIVSRRRILDNRLRVYQNLLDKFHAPADHWIWKEGWWNDDPSNPTLGHALERTWPVIFDCTDGSVAQTCGEGNGPTCQCLDS